MITASALTYRTIDPERDATLAIANYWDACLASYGSSAPSHYQGATAYLNWLKARVEEFPEGHVLACRDEEVVGQLELQIPYGMRTGYINLYHVAERWRGQGRGRAMHEYVERYFRSWEATVVELHVSPMNQRAMGFYRRMGYRVVSASEGAHTWRMERALG